MASRNPGNNLPAATTSFVGRTLEIQDVVGLFERGRLVTIAGVGGVGKTRLALEVSARLLEYNPGGVWFVDLAAIKNPALVSNSIALAIGVSDQSTQPMLDKIVTHFGDRAALLVLDNCEHLVDSVAEVIANLLRRAGNLRILATSRVVLGVDGEHVFTVAPLTVPDPEAGVGVEELRAYESVDLLLERAAAVQHGLELTDETAGSIARLCVRLDGLPLAIELAASRLRSLPIDQIVDRLEDRFELLTGGNRSALPRQRTLRALIDWSYDLCSPDERVLWSRLSVFADSFSLAAAEGVCAGDDLPRESVIDTIDSLVGQSVLTLVNASGAPRYRMLETIRRYGWERLVENGEDARTQRDHARYFTDLAVECERRWFGPHQEEDLARLRTEHGNLTLALDWSMHDPGNVEQALRLVAALRYHWCSDGFLSEGRRRTDQALALGAPDSPELLQALVVSAWVLLLQGDRDSASVALDRAEVVATKFGDDSTLAELSVWRGTHALFGGDLDGAEASFSAAVDRLVARGEPERALMALFQLADTRAHLHDPRSADAARMAVGISERVGERWTKSYALWSVGLDAWVRGELDLAGTMTKSALVIQKGFNDHVGAALMIELIAWIAASKRDFQRAALLLGAIDAIWERIGTRIANFGPHLQEHHELCEHAVRKSLPASTVEGLWTEGRVLHLDQAIDVALDFHGNLVAPESSDEILSPRERDVAELVADGLTNKGIAERLVISIRTVDSHVQSILSKLGVSSRAQIAVWVVTQRAILRVR